MISQRTFPGLLAGAAWSGRHWLPIRIDTELQKAKCARKGGINPTLSK